MTTKAMRIFSVRAILIAHFLWAIAAASATAAQRSDTKSEPVSDQVLMQEMRNEIRRLSQELQKYKAEQYQIELEYAKKYYTYLGNKADANIEQFQWQRSASERLLWLVVVVVLSGVVFSGLQIWKASRTADLQAGAGGGDKDIATSIEVTIQKVKVTSSVVGVLVLTISIVFFYFFLIEVYRIKVVDLSTTEVKPPHQIDTTNAGGKATTEAPKSQR